MPMGPARRMTVIGKNGKAVERNVYTTGVAGLSLFPFRGKFSVVHDASGVILATYATEDAAERSARVLCMGLVAVGLDARQPLDTIRARRDLRPFLDAWR